MFRPLLISLCLTSTALATTWTVDDDGKADFDNIQAAVDAASDGDEIVVMPGTYTSTQDGHVVDMLGKAVTLRSSDPSDPDVVASTIIDGENTRRGLVCLNNETSKTIISGFTIANGFSVDFDYDGDGMIGGYDRDGGGMLNYNSSPTLTDCTFENNTSDFDGGGMYNNYYSSPTLTSCTFTGNSANSGGGMWNTNSSPTLTDCTFTGNTANYGGGGMYNEISSNPNLINCTFENNSAGSGGGGALLNIESISDSTIENCYFIGNYALEFGGGGAIKNKTNSYGVFSNCYFVSNYGSAGGAVLNSGPMPPVVIFTGCQFRNNMADHAIPPGSNGWAIYSQSTYVIVINTMFCSNDISGSSEPYYVDGGGNTFLGECPDCPDINGDGNVDVGDLLTIIDQWGLPNSPADVNFDGIVDVSDLLIVVGNWGPCE